MSDDWISRDEPVETPQEYATPPINTSGATTRANLVTHDRVRPTCCRFPGNGTSNDAAAPAGTVAVCAGTGDRRGSRRNTAGQGHRPAASSAMGGSAFCDGSAGALVTDVSAAGSSATSTVWSGATPAACCRSCTSCRARATRYPELSPGACPVVTLRPGALSLVTVISAPPCRARLLDSPAGSVSAS